MTRPSAGARPQPLIAVRDVKAGTRWYEQVLGARRLGKDDHGGRLHRRARHPDGEAGGVE